MMNTLRGTPSKSRVEGAGRRAAVAAGGGAIARKVSCFLDTLLCVLDTLMRVLDTRVAFGWREVLALPESGLAAYPEVGMLAVNFSSSSTSERTKLVRQT